MPSLRPCACTGAAFVRICAALGLVALAACETVEGFGQDIQSGGEAIEEASEDAQ